MKLAMLTFLYCREFVKNSIVTMFDFNQSFRTSTVKKLLPIAFRFLNISKKIHLIGKTTINWLNPSDVRANKDVYAFSSGKDNFVSWMPFSQKAVELYLQKLILITQLSVKCLTTPKALLFWDLTKLMIVCRQEMKPKCQVCPVSCHLSCAWFHINYLVFSHQCRRRETESFFR